MHILNTPYANISGGETIAELMRRHSVPGCSIAVIRSGALDWSCARGARDAQGAPLTDGVLFECASLTKSLFALLAMQEADMGKLDLDAPIAPLLNDAPWSDDPRFMGITPRHCLCHGSGLPNWQAKPMDILFDPGTDFSYSGEGYFLLQRLVEQLESKAMDSLFRERFFQPFAMESSAACWTPAVGAAFSQGFARDGSVCKVRDGRRVTGNSPEPNAAWSLYSHAADYARFLTAMINFRGGLSQSAFEAMTRPQNRACNEVDWGLGFGIPRSDANVMWHWGDNSGFKSFAVWDKLTGDGAVVTTNSDNGLEFCFDLLKYLTDGGFFDAIASFISSAE
jgi:CubicO group peptidase (beta-lactamase class C family)